MTPACASCMGRPLAAWVDHLAALLAAANADAAAEKTDNSPERWSALASCWATQL